MSALSIFVGEGGPAYGCANPIYVISKEGDTLSFEVREEDASYLKTLVGNLLAVFGPPCRRYRGKNLIR